MDLVKKITLSLIFLFLIGLFLPYLGINLFTTSPLNTEDTDYSKQRNNSIKNITTKRIPTYKDENEGIDFDVDKFLATTTKNEKTQYKHNTNHKPLQKKPTFPKKKQPQHRTFDDIVSEINQE